MTESRTSPSEPKQTTIWNLEDVQQHNHDLQFEDAESEAEKKALAAEILRDLPFLCLKGQMPVNNPQRISNSFARVGKASESSENTNMNDFATSKKVIDAEDATHRHPIDETMLHQSKSTPEEFSRKELHHQIPSLQNEAIKFFVGKQSPASSYKSVAIPTPIVSASCSCIHEDGQFDDVDDCDSLTSSSVKTAPIVSPCGPTERAGIENNNSNISLPIGKGHQPQNFKLESPHRVSETSESGKQMLTHWKHSPNRNKQGKSPKSTQDVEYSWYRRFNELQQFKHCYGHCDVPKRYVDNPRLGNWVNKQRAQYKNLLDCKPSQLSQNRIDALKRIGFSWNVSKHDFWNKRFDDLKRFKAREGHCMVPTRYSENSELGNWVNRQRMLYRSIADKRTKPSQLVMDRLKELDDFGFVWKVQISDMWEKQFEELEKFKELKGHCCVPQRYSENLQLGRWTGTQRIQYKYFMEGKPSLLNEVRIGALESIGFVWFLNRRGGKRERRLEEEEEGSKKLKKKKMKKEMT